MVSNSALLCLATYLATFQKKLGDFFQIIWSHWLKVASIINILGQLTQKSV
jgi:hypothetical protein